MVDTEPSSSHQLARIASGFSSPQAVRSRSCRPSCVSQHRQYDGCCLHQQNGGDAFPNIVLPVVGSNDVVHAQAYHASGTAPSGQTEPHCRCAVAQSGGPNNRMGASTGSSQSGFLPLGDTDGGSVCDFCKSQTSDFCLSHSRCSGHGSRRPINVMGRDDRVRVPSVSVDSPRFEQNSEGQRVADIDSADLAKQVVVPSPVGINGRPPDPVAGSSGTVISGSRPGASGPQSVPPSRIQVVEQSLIAKGFSRSTAVVIARPQRSSTLATYEHVWRKFSNCREFRNQYGGHTNSPPL